ncbi:MAG: hypothetical protein HY738_15100, partial [Bacteroidia bacterium]|nr:hypothetical protein [Bacteroidia bacterium]
MHDKFFYFFNPQPELTIPPIYPDTNISRINVPDTVLKAIPGTPGDTDSIKEILLIETKAGSHQDSIKKEITVDKDTSFSAAGDSIFQGADSSDINFNITIDPDSFIYIFKAEEIIFSPESLFTHIPALPKELKKEKTLPTDSIKTHKQIAEKKIITRLESDTSQ